jgi:hypothetical protein
LSLPNASVAVTVVADGPSATGAVTTSTAATAAAALGAGTSGITTGLCMLCQFGPRKLEEVMHTSAGAVLAGLLGASCKESVLAHALSSCRHPFSSA